MAGVGVRQRGAELGEITFVQRAPNFQDSGCCVVQRVGVTPAFMRGLYNKFDFSNEVSGFRVSNSAIFGQLINMTVSLPSSPIL